MAALASGLLYAWTAAPTIGGGDAAELATAAAVFGIPHPPGYPLYTLATALVVRVLPVASPAAAANLASGLWAALAVGLAVHLVRRLGAGGVGMLATGLALALGRTLWSQATISEVYTFDLLLAVGTLHAALSLARAGPSDAQSGDARVSVRPALVFGVLLGLWLGHRPVNVLFVPGVLLLGYGWSVERRPSAKEVGVAVLGSIASLGVFAYLPWFSSGDPALDVGDPESWDRFWVVVRATPYLRHLEGGTSELVWARFGRALAALPFEVGAAIVLAPVGLLAGVRGTGSKRVLLGWLWILVATLVFGSRYHVLDVEVFFLPATLVLALCSAPGADALSGSGGWRKHVVLGALVVVGLGVLPVRYPERDRSTETQTELFARDLLASCESDALLFVNGDTSIHALWYLQAVEGVRTDVAVVSLGHVRPWYVEQLAARHPAIAWPPVSQGTPPSAWARELVAGGADLRQIYLSLAVDPSPFLRPASGAGERSFGSVPRGIVSWLLPYGTEIDAAQLSDFQHEFFERAIDQLLPMPATIDMDTKSIVSQYALGLQGACDLWAARKELDRLRSGCEMLIALDPDRHEEDVRLDVLQGLGQELPALELGRRARERLAEL